MKTTLIWLVVFLYMVPMVLSAPVWCYQEFANQSTACGGLATGRYSVGSNLFDGNWSSYEDASETLFLMNYTKPANATNASLWQIKDMVGTRNLTIPSVCWNWNATILKLSSHYTSFIAYWSCFNGTTLNVIDQQSSASQRYEEAMWWQLTQFNTSLGIYDEKTSLPLNINWSFEAWGNISFNKSVVGTNISTTLLTGDNEYNIKYFSSGYSTRNIYIQIESSQYIKLYLLNNSNALLTQYTITDLSALPIVSAKISVYRKMMSSNNWELVEQSISDQNGQGSLSLEPYTANYKFIITDSSDAIIFSSPTSQTISSNTIFFKSQVLSNNMQSYWNMLNIKHNISFSNATGNLTFNWYDPTNSVVYGSLLVYQINGLASTLVCNSTHNTSIDSALCELTPYRNDSSNTYHSQGILYVNGSLYQVEIYDNNFASTSTLWGISGVSMALLIVLIMTCMGLWNPSAAMMFAGIGIIISSWFGLIPLSYMWLAGLLALIAIALWRMKT